MDGTAQAVTLEGADEQEELPEEAEKLVIDDEEFLRICHAERINSIGMYYGDEIMRQRDTALRYYKGDMSMAPEMGGIPALPNRSSAVSTDVSDALWTAMPDLMEIFMGGEEMGSFSPLNDQDEEAAKQETEAVNHVILQQNDGFQIVHDALHDALLEKVGVFMAWVEEVNPADEEVIKNMPATALAQVSPEDIVSIQEAGIEPGTGQPLFQVELRQKKTCKICVASVAPEDFATARDTTGTLRKATYCVMRSLPRAQDLIAQGYDPEKVATLNTYSPTAQQEIDRARDTAGEHDRVTSISDTRRNMRQVVVHRHVVRVDADGDGKPEVWLIDTDDKEGLLLQKKRLNQVCFAAGSPFRQPHRFYGRSLADILLEVQKIKTALTRAALDGRYFALNRRYEVNMSSANEFTLPDLLNNTPGFPVRSKDGNAIKPLYDKGFDGADLEALEYFSTVAEQRTGIVRNAQGLNPDTLHDTAAGAQILMSAAQKRLRLIARTLGETMFRDLFLLVHALMRQHCRQVMPVPVGKEWIQVDPSSWGEREHFKIEIGLGGGRDHDIMMLNNIGALMEKMLSGQASGAISTPVVTPENVYNFGHDITERSGKKNGDRYFTDPQITAAQQAQQPQQPDPEVMKLQMQAQLEREKMQQADNHTRLQAQKDMQVAAQQQADERERNQVQAVKDARQAEIDSAKLQLEAQKAANEHAIEMRKLEIEEARLQAEMEKVRIEHARLEHEREMGGAELAIKQREGDLKDREIDQRSGIELAKLADVREGRAVEMDDRRMERESRAKEKAETPKSEAKEKPEKPDRSGEAIGEGLKAVGEGLKAISRPKKVKRDKDGNVEGIE